MVLKGAIQRLFYNLLSAPWTVSNTCTQVAGVQSHSTHLQHMSWAESLTEFKLHLTYLFFIG